MAVVLMLDHCGRGEQSRRLSAALDQVLLVSKVRTRDLGGTAGTREFGDAVVQALG